MRERRRDYELMFIISPLRSSEEQIAATIDRVQQAITAAGGEVTNIDHAPPWGRRKFAYPIREYAEGEASRRSFTEGYYVLCHFNLPAARVTDVERAIKLNDAVLRYLLTLVDTRDRAAPPLSAAASASHAVLEAEEESDEEGEEELDEELDEELSEDEEA